jgi:Protein of unknown function (DUF1800)
MRSPRLGFLYDRIVCERCLPVVKRLLIGLWCSLLVWAVPNDVVAKPRSPAKVRELLRKVSVKSGNRTLTITCRGAEPGASVKRKDGSVGFVTYKALIGMTKDRVRRKFMILGAIGLRACRTTTPATPVPTATPTATPSSPSVATPLPPPNPLPSTKLSPYQGIFGSREARILFGRFAIGASPERIDEAVRDGLEKTVDRLTSFVEESFEGRTYEEAEFDLRCDGYLKGHKDDNPRMCATDDPGDFQMDAGRIAYYLRLVHTKNPYFEKLAFFLHDERMAASARTLEGSDRAALVAHIDLLRKNARSGDFTQFLRDWNSDLMGNLTWLDGALNKGSSPNENYAREFWELGTTGPTSLDGKPVYSDADVAEAALAHSGWTIARAEAPNNLGKKEWRGIKKFDEKNHAPGSFTIFRGTPYEAKVSTAEDVLKATLAHPRTSEHLAEDLWKEFIAPTWSTSDITELAKVVRESNFDLHRIMRRVMKASVIYDSRNYKTLIKHPVELLLSFLYAFPDFPIPNYDKNVYWMIDRHLQQLGQQLLLPPSIFGWNEKRLAAQSFVFNWRKVVEQIVGVGWEPERGSQYLYLPKIFPALKSSSDAVAQVMDRLHIATTADQRTQLVQFMDFTMGYCASDSSSQPECKAGKRFYPLKKAFDPTFGEKDPWSHRYKIQGLIALGLMSSSFRTK